MDVKVCTACKESLPLDMFYKNSSKKDGLNPYCKPCHNAKNKRWAEANPDKAKDSQKKRDRTYKDNHPERVNAMKRRWEAANPERAKAQTAKANKKYRENNPEKVQEINKKSQRTYYEKNREELLEKNRIWVKQNPERVRIIRRKKGRNREGLKRAQGNGTRLNFEAILDRDQGICYLCDTPIEAGDLHFDHVVPLSRGGAHSEENVRCTHSWCNLSKGPDSLRIWCSPLVPRGNTPDLLYS